MLSSAPTAAISSVPGITCTTSEIIVQPNLTLSRDSQNTFLHTFQTPFPGPTEVGAKAHRLAAMTGLKLVMLLQGKQRGKVELTP